MNPKGLVIVLGLAACVGAALVGLYLAAGGAPRADDAMAAVARILAVVGVGMLAAANVMGRRRMRRG